MKDLIEYRRKITSQDGEDGILAEIFRRLGIKKGSCVEFGAWDGKHLSNTWDLWKNKNWNAVLIEGDSERCSLLKDEYGGLDNVDIVNTYVGIDGEQSLDSILTKTDLPKNFELLSIDIDGDDYHVWKSLSKFTPKVVIIEYNPSIPPDLEIVDTPGAREFGASAASLLELGKSKQYKLATCTRTNMVFVKNALFKKLGINNVELKTAFQYDHIRYVIGTYSGKMYMSKPEKLGHINTRGLLSFRALLKPKYPPPAQDAITPVIVHEVDWIQKSGILSSMLELMVNIMKIFVRK